MELRFTIEARTDDGEEIELPQSVLYVEISDNHTYDLERMLQTIGLGIWNNPGASGPIFISNGNQVGTYWFEEEPN